jgi:hypothetical protein
MRSSRQPPIEGSGYTRASRFPRCSGFAGHPLRLNQTLDFLAVFYLGFWPHPARALCPQPLINLCWVLPFYRGVLCGDELPIPD